MPRGPRLDIPGALHHVMVRGIDQQNIFVSDADRNDLLYRLGDGVLRSGVTVYAWALMSNHFHILLRSGSEGLSTTMRRLLTGYAVRFNRRHRRWGHLFQNRYKSILVEEDSYLLELVRYIHLSKKGSQKIRSWLFTVDSGKGRVSKRESLFGSAASNPERKPGLQREIESANRHIDRLVYELYDLTGIWGLA